MLTLHRAPSRRLPSFFRCRLMAENASTAGMMASVRVSLTMVAKSPAASLKA